jgi:CheY-like chemotaxis protein
VSVPADGWAEVLIAEDNLADVELMRVAVEDCGTSHPLRFVRDGEEALDVLRRGGPAPCLVILDLNMPRLGGLEVLAALRAGGLQAPPVVIFTSSGDDGDRQRALDLGAAAYLVKPVQFSDFCEVITRLLRDHTPRPG